MPLLFNLPATKKFRRELRHNPSPAELIFWQYLKGRKFFGLKFRRQHGIGAYIVDFYYPALRLVIEIDGDSHFDLSGYSVADIQRQQWIEQKGIHVVRFRNDEVLQDTTSALERLQQVIEMLPRHHP